MRLQDNVDALEHDALGMFFYNQRALFFIASGALLMALCVAAIFNGFDPRATRAIALLSIAWLASVAATLVLHARFLRQLRSWAAARVPLDLPPIFDVYFILDSGLLLLAYVGGRFLGVRLSPVGFLLAANAIVYAAYVFGGHASKLAKGGVIFALFATALLLVPIRQHDPFEHSWFYESFLGACIAAMLLITIFSVTMMAALAATEHHVTRQQLALLGRYQDILLGEVDVTPHFQERQDTLHSERLFRKRLRALFRDLCSPSYDFWYRGIAAWFVEDHRDRGSLYLPAAYEGVPEAAAYRDGIATATQFLRVDHVVLLHSLSAQSDVNDERWMFRNRCDVAAAIVPLRRDNVVLGALQVFGDEHSPPVPRGDEQFLSTLASLVVTAMEQWRSRFHVSAHKELDALFGCQSLSEVFPQAVRVLQRYLEAEGCMLIFRPDPAGTEMVVSATAGFDKGIVNSKYTVGIGQTGRCAENGETIRVDDVETHRKDFDVDLLGALEQFHGQAVRSWMAIPIGVPPRNYGVIKVVNSKFPTPWFTEDDQQLGEDLAVRLQLMIELFLHIRRVEEAREAAQKSALVAQNLQKLAETSAKERLQDLITITHQQQGPLIAVIGALTGIQADSLKKGHRDLLDHARALVEDALTVGYGTFTTFGKAAGVDTAFVESEIDANRELRLLAERLKRTNARPDVHFEYREDRGFPRLRLDVRVFTSVLYTLIHNAMKYADWNSVVTLECGFERATGEPAIKVKSVGAPIHPSEREVIFERFRRGRSVERGKIYSGVGLGLWVGRELMRAIGGDLRVELSSEHPRLSVFVASVPLGAIAR